MKKISEGRELAEFPVSDLTGETLSGEIVKQAGSIDINRRKKRPDNHQEDDIRRIRMLLGIERLKRFGPLRFSDLNGLR